MTGEAKSRTDGYEALRVLVEALEHLSVHDSQQVMRYHSEEQVFITETPAPSSELSNESHALSVALARPGSIRLCSLPDPRLNREATLLDCMRRVDVNGRRHRIPAAIAYHRSIDGLHLDDFWGTIGRGSHELV